ncbi:hypothetical protein K503DRAFT_345305 [Rhizopogon vinicolor AM-OR11-026]|uniref:Uncharacterized protein n=1 Tax=Rhizopogon vinicolor AM-OR11-026 TaxID=1314800 RepID=A0A1B7MT41_9AGAM|nr:hypothetical protein K503DRAFT_345305 [Rhizopogon vinicolor AM-OR11-026]
MDTFTRNNLVQHISFLHDSSLLNPEAAHPPPVFTLAPPCSHPWQPIQSCSRSSFFSFFSEEDFPPLNSQAVSGPSSLKRLDPARLYPTPPSSASPSKSTIPLPEERGEFTPIFTIHSPGILDSPTVMRREDLACHKPPTPPPTQLLHNLELPGYEDSDDSSMDEGEDINHHQSDFEEDDFDDGPFAMSDGTSESASPLSPLSPPWKPSEQSLANSSHWDGTPTSPFSWSPFLESKDMVPDMSIPLSNDITPFQSSHQAPYLLGVDSFRPRLVPLHIPWSSHQRIMHQLDEHSPSSRRHSTISLTDMDIDEPRSPHLSHSSLPELEHEKVPPQIPPSSPSRRSCSYLPEDADSSQPPPPPPSPGISLLSFPGADTDDDLLPDMDVCEPPTPSRVPFVPSQPLLFIHDPRDVPLPRSPSPEDFNLCLSAHDMDSDPELAQLFDLRKRALAAVQGGPFETPECLEPSARKATRRDRERSKEVGALLRLKLGDKHAMDVSEWQNPERRRRGVIGNISQLVAQMVFRRHDSSRPLTKRKSLSAQEYMQSPLSACVAADS